LEGSCFIDSMEYWLLINVHYVDNELMVEVNLIAEGKLESSWRLASDLVLVTELVNLFNGYCINVVISCSCEDFVKSFCGWMTKALMELRKLYLSEVVRYSLLVVKQEL
jgi:hypothetical protein